MLVYYDVNNIKQNKLIKSNFKPKFVPAGQTTQMIIGATPESDLKILKLSEGLYQKLKLKRVYYSAYISVVLGSVWPIRCWITVMSIPPWSALVAKVGRRI